MNASPNPNLSPDQPPAELLEQASVVSLQITQLMVTAWTNGVRDTLSATGTQMRSFAGQVALIPGAQPVAELINDLSERFTMSAHELVIPTVRVDENGGYTV